MLRHFYVCDDMGDLKLISTELENNGFTKPQIHLISKTQGTHHLDTFMPISDEIFKSLLLGNSNLYLAVFIAVLITIFLYIYGFMLLSIAWFSTAVVGLFFAFFTNKEHDLFLNTNNTVDPEMIKNEVESGRYVLLVELNNRQEPQLKKIVTKHPELKVAGNHEVFLN
ncbi:hypothetical protein RI845_11750 [Thalassotalea nanhaiensis]|uniref:DUF1269 domain-containing protein n=1 Tax=Thalassotalea nanhaiensis TaxID=3065648 RepID=A0ABY9THC5_9GAMM|nr:hypothetical protein RI845_11750 [Colwelliaceae bacterium SQ345]